MNTLHIGWVYLSRTIVITATLLVMLAFSWGYLGHPAAAQPTDDMGAIGSVVTTALAGTEQADPPAAHSADVPIDPTTPPATTEPQPAPPTASGDPAPPVPITTDPPTPPTEKNRGICDSPTGPVRCTS